MGQRVQATPVALLPAAAAAADPNALPSPATPNDTGLLDCPTPALFPLPPGQQSPDSITQPHTADESWTTILLPPEPSPSYVQPAPVTTPATENPAHSGMNLFVGGALAPMHKDVPRSSPPKHGPGLRLPSFRALGIAAPHPDRFGHLVMDTNTSDSPDGMTGGVDPRRRADSVLVGALAANHLSPQFPKAAAAAGGGLAALPPFRHDVAALTPPADAGDIAWHRSPTVSASALDSPATDPGMISASASPGGESRAQLHTSSPSPERQTECPSAGSWIAAAIDATLENLQTATMASNPLRVLSHALPSPSSTGHIFPTVIDAIHSSTPSQPTVWINVFHAIQGRFNLADLPTSPPSTPGPPLGGDDYFTQKVFDSAVPVADYQQDLSSLPRSPRPVVPPSSINVSIVERYIPPATPHEFSDMFNPQGPSLLVDRLVELSPDNGSLVFVYPTRAGARTFTRQYLSPILDPLLRSIVVQHGLSSNLSVALGRMLAVEQMLEYEQLHRSISALCAKLTQRSSGMQRFHGQAAKFSLVHASREQVHLSREVWAKDWWTKQEKPRIRDAMTRYAQEAQKKSSNEHVDRAPSPTELIQQLLDGVLKRPYDGGEEPSRGVEVSVFVIKRSD